MKKNILIVEDDPKAAKSAEKFFSDKYSCFIAQDLQEALDLLSENVFDYVITDTFYPQETGSGKKDYVHRMIKDVLAQIESGVKNGNLTEGASAKASIVINEWANPDEFIQPLGLWLIKILLDCHYKINQLVMTTNLNHHAELFEPIWCSKVSYSRKFPLKLSCGGFQRSGWPFLQECVNDPDGKYQRWFWEGIQEYLDNS